MPDAPKKKKSFFQKVATVAKDFQEWVEETFGDPELAAEFKDDLGLDATNPATPTPADPAAKARLEAFAAKQDVDEAALLAVIADIKATVDTVMTFVDAVKTDGVDARTLFWMLFKVWSLDVLRVRNPAAYSLVQIANLVTEDEETLLQIDQAKLTKLVRGEATAADGEAWVQRFSMLGGVTVVLFVTFWDALGGVIDVIYGWDPDPEDEGEAAVIASRALTVVLDADELGGVRPALTLIGVPAAHGGPGLFVSTTVGFQFATDLGPTTYTMELVGAGQFGLLIASDPQVVANFAPSIRISAEPKRGDTTPVDAPALIIGTADSSRLQIGALAYGVEVGADRAAFRLGVRKAKLVVALGKADSFLRQLPGGNIEVPFEIAMLADTVDGIRFEGGSGIKVNLPISASLFGVFTIQFLELELKFQPELAVDLRGGFSLTLGPFAASIDRIGLTLKLHELESADADRLTDLVAFAPPKGIGLVLDAGVVKGGGYLFIDAERGEYAGALELKFLTFSIKAIGLLSTKRPDGSDGWSLLLFVFGQFNIHIAFGIFWTGLGGMVGLHHTADVDALTAGMRTGALDDILFPENPVADAPRIINRYRTLFPVKAGNFLVGPMLELSFSQPPIVYVRLGVILDIRNALGGGPMALSKVIVVGQVLVQMPPKETKAPAILKLLIDVVGFYDCDTEFLLIRARLRDSFVGIEHFAKLDLAGELLIAAQFGADPSFILSAGGFHPKYEGLPARVPKQLDRLRVSFGIGPVKMSNELYFAVTPNSVQAGFKTSIVADFGVAGIEASLGFDALLYLSPRFYFLVDVEFKAKVKAFGETLASVGVTATLEGPDRWRIKGEFSFSILWWDKTVPFEESWGEVEAADTGTTSLSAALTAELGNPDNLTPEGPVSGASPVTLAPAKGTDKLAHPLGRLAIRQKAVPFDLTIDRLGTKKLAGGPATVGVERVLVNDSPQASFEATTESFARGQFMELSDEERLTGKVFEPFRSGVVVGTTQAVAPDALGRDVKASFETVRLDPEPQGVITKWTFVRIGPMIVAHDGAVEASKLGAAARSERAFRQRRVDVTDTVTVSEPPLALVAPGTFSEAASLIDQAKLSPTLAAQHAALGGLKVIEAFEVMA